MKLKFTKILFHLKFKKIKEDSMNISQYLNLFTLLLLTSIFNSWVVDRLIFPYELNVAEIIPVDKKNNTTDKTNYRPVSLLYL